MKKYMLPLALSVFSLSMHGMSSSGEMTKEELENFWTGLKTEIGISMQPGASINSVKELCAGLTVPQVKQVCQRAQGTRFGGNVVYQFLSSEQQEAVHEWIQAKADYKTYMNYIDVVSLKKFKPVSARQLHSIWKSADAENQSKVLVQLKGLPFAFSFEDVARASYMPHRLYFEYYVRREKGYKIFDAKSLCNQEFREWIVGGGVENDYLNPSLAIQGKDGRNYPLIKLAHERGDLNVLQAIIKKIRAKNVHQACLLEAAYLPGLGMFRLQKQIEKLEKKVDKILDVHGVSKSVR